MKQRISPATRISMGLALVTVSAFWAAQALNLIPDTSQTRQAGRRDFCEAVAIYCSAAIDANDTTGVKSATEAIVARNKDVVSAGLRLDEGQLVMATPGHEGNWKLEARAASTADQVRVPIFRNDKPWGAVEIAFQPTGRAGLRGWLNNDIVRLTAFVATLSLIGYRLYLRKTLQYLDPSSVIPDRVKQLLNTLAEGVLVLDDKERIILANDAFAAATGHEANALQGRKPSQLQWRSSADDDSDKPAAKAPEYPWLTSLRDGAVHMGVLLRLRPKAGDDRLFSTNCAPIHGDDNRTRGALVTFGDITPIEKKNEELHITLDMLEHSRSEIERQNKELQLLATIDPLTGCRNRRAFFTDFEAQWKSAQRYKTPLSCVMVDIDHFKSINDKHGHAVGDHVLQRVAAALKSAKRDSDIVCRYGGEEFCLLLPQSDLNAAVQAAERLRVAVAACCADSVPVTASFGAAALDTKMRLPQDLLEEADKALYVAKRSGRNRVVRADAMPDVPAERPATPAGSEPSGGLGGPTPVSFHVVTSLMSALAYRDRATAEHSQRVATLCVAASEGLISVKESFVLEVAALLHDIGKMGVPDAILLKPAALTPAEWAVMRSHEDMGVDIIAAAFASAELTDIVHTHHAWYGGTAEHPTLPRGENISISARILSIADAYDAIVSDRVYRKKRSREEAFAELRRCAGTQFDPALVERFIRCVMARDDSRRHHGKPMSDTTALRIRLEMGILLCAAAANETDKLIQTARRLAHVAGGSGWHEVADRAAALEQAAQANATPKSLGHLTRELAALCRTPPA